VGCAFEDPRQRHPLDIPPDVTEHQLGPAVRRFPGVRFLVTNAPLTVADMVVRHTPDQENVVFDTTGFAGPLSDAIHGALRLLGSRRLLLGTHAPFKYPEVGLLRVQTLDTDDETRASILGGNALRLFGDPAG
jgi:predicted TIM-barrel fold metal-dependent hydrolase